MDSILKSIGAVFLIVVMVGFGALLSGTILWFIWPIAIPIVFPGVVASGMVSAIIPWWSAVCLTWIFGILIKSTQTNNNKD